MLQRIMLATDFSERSDRALRRAVLLARAHGAALELIHVVDDDRPQRIVDREMADTRSLLMDLAQSLRAADGIACTVDTVLADPFSGIVQAAEQRRPDLLVLGPHRRQVLRDAFAGTTAERTIRTTNCPVLMVNGPPAAPWRHALLTTDLTDQSRAALSRFVSLGLTATPASVLHVFDVLALRLTMSGTLHKEDRDLYLSDQASAARSRLAAFIQGISGLQAGLMVRHDETTQAHEILQAADEAGADLIVMANHGKGMLARMILGSVTARVLQSAPVDVLVFPASPD